MGAHASLNRINPTGQQGVWRCTRCKAEGTLAELGKVACSDPSPATDKELLDAVDGDEEPPEPRLEDIIPAEMAIAMHRRN